MPQVGLAELQALLVEDREGIVAGLDQRMLACVDAHRDPWLEGREPVTIGQFADSLPLMPLPLVPLRNGSASARNGAAASGPFASGTGTAERAGAQP